MRYHACLFGMTRRATKKPGSFTKPAHWNSEPAPEPRAVVPPSEDGQTHDGDEEGRLSPTRYGDWCKDGIAIDF